MHVSDKIMAEAWEIMKEYSYRRIGLRPPPFTSEKWTCKDCKYWSKQSRTSDFGTCTQLECGIILSKGFLKACSYFVYKKQD